MIDAFTMLAARVAEDKTGQFRDGTAYYVQSVHPAVHDDPPVLDFVRRSIREEVARHCTAEGQPIHPDDVTITAVTPDEFVSKYRELASPMEPPDPPAFVAEHHHYVGHWTPAPPTYGPLLADERRARVALIAGAARTMIGMLTTANERDERLTGWTLPATWDPGEHPRPPARPTDQPEPATRVYGRPVTFAGTLIVGHLSDGTTLTERPTNPETQAAAPE